MKKYKKTCKECNKEFISKSPRSLFCSSNCKTKEFKKRVEYKHVCENCNKKFNSNSKRTKFCSNICVGKYKNIIGTGKIKKCKECKENFNQKHKRHFFCSDKCKRKFQNRNIEKIKVKCSNCNKIINRDKYIIKIQKLFFCCKNCESVYREKESDDVRVCEICGKSFNCKKGDKLILCSYKCQGEWQSIYRSGKNHPSYKHEFGDEERIKKCEFCDKNIIDTPEELKKRRFCSRTCAIYGNDKTLTLPHRTIAESMINMNFDIEHEFQIGRYVADIHLRNTNILFEINGTYWHSDIRFHKIPERKERKEGINIDRRKKDKLYNKGYKILYLWEYDITYNLEMCEQLILKFIKKNGILKNYHSMNYSLIKNKLKLNDKILVPHFEKK